MGFDNLSVIMGIDYRDRFEVVYNFFSYIKKQKNPSLRLFLIMRIPKLFRLQISGKWQIGLSERHMILSVSSSRVTRTLQGSVLPEGWVVGSLERIMI